MSGDPIRSSTGEPTVSLAVLLASTYRQLGTAVQDRIAAQGGVPELQDPDLALDRLLAAAHRATGSAVTERLTRTTNGVSERRPLSPETALAVHHPLTGRLASVRLKYRREALRLASTYWPKDLALAMRAALSIVEDLNYLLEADELVPQVRHCTEQLAEHLAQIDLLPSPQRQRRSEQAGANYLTDVEVLLESHAEQLLRDVHSAQQLLSGELAPLIDTAEVDDDCLLAYTIAQDLADDLEQAHGKAQALCLVVGAVEKVSSDFVGEDLSQANLDHVPLKGIRWDAATLWPEEWEALIRRASMPASGEQGVLIVATEPHDSVVSADA